MGHVLSRSADGAKLPSLGIYLNASKVETSLDMATLMLDWRSVWGTIDFWQLCLRRGPETFLVLFSFATRNLSGFQPASNYPLNRETPLPRQIVLIAPCDPQVYVQEEVEYMEGYACVWLHHATPRFKYVRR